MEKLRNDSQIGVSFRATRNLDLSSVLPELEQSGVSFIHLDFFDGLMVKSHGLSDRECLEIRRLTKLPLEAHLMEVVPRDMSFYRDLGIDRVLIHQESIGNKEQLLLSAKQAGMEAGIALKPGAAHNILTILHPEITDMVLVLGTKSGSGGEVYDEQVPDRVKQLASIYSRPIEVNSGIITLPSQAPEDCSLYYLYLAGARRFSMGRGIFNIGLPISEAVKLNIGVLLHAQSKANKQR